MTGQLAAFARLRALRDLDLELVRVHQIFGSHAEPGGGHLLDAGAKRVALVERNVADDRGNPRHQGLAGLRERIPLRILAAFAGIRFAADPVHRDGERRVRLGGDRAEAHRAGGEALDDLGSRLDILERDRHVRKLELEQSAQRQHPLRLVVDERGVLFVRPGVARARRVLQLRDRIRRPHMVFAANPVVVLAARVERIGE